MGKGLSIQGLEVSKIYFESPLQKACDEDYMQVYLYNVNSKKQT